MNRVSRSFASLLVLAVGSWLSGSAGAQNAAAPDTSAHMLVTVEARHGSDVPEVGRADVMVTEGHHRDEVTGGFRRRETLGRSNSSSYWTTDLA